MTARNLRTRIEKLEVSRKRIGEMLFVWRLPGADIESALANASYMPALPVAINLRTTLDNMAFAGLGEFTHAFSWLPGIREPERCKTHQ
jgi:hypothetical protein